MMHHRLRISIQGGLFLLAGLAGALRAEDYAITSFAGNSNVTGAADGTGQAATFNNPFDVAIDAAKSLSVTDTVNQTIRKITPARVVTTFAGLAGTFGTAD